MISTFDRITRQFLLSVDPEMAHAMSIAALKTGLPLGERTLRSQRLRVRVAGLDLPNPLGMAAGFDKNAEVPDALLGLGFGFAEVGTVTPKAQPGNPKPRVFRLSEDQAVINRLGFNNEGHEACLKRLKARRQRGGIVGVNIGANKDSADRIADYRLGVERFAAHASYLTVNISSPNTPGLRDLQARASLDALLEAVMAERDAQIRGGAGPTPVFLKIAPDLEDAGMKDVAESFLTHKVDGLIVSNTTLARDGISSKFSSEAGGLSGHPVFARTTAVLARMRRLLGPDAVIIGVGGIDSADTALEKIRAGADLVQLYTGMIFAGPGLPGRILRDMTAILQRDEVKSLRAIRDTRIAHWEGVRLR